MAAVAGICPDWSGGDVSFEIRRMRVRAEERVSPSDVPDPPGQWAITGVIINVISTPRQQGEQLSAGNRPRSGLQCEH